MYKRRVFLFVMFVGMICVSIYKVIEADTNPVPSFMPPMHAAPMLDMGLHKRLFTNGTYSDVEFLNKCQPCHGGSTRLNSKGSEYSKTTALRYLGGLVITRDTPVGCSLCHST